VPAPAGQPVGARHVSSRSMAVLPGPRFSITLTKSLLRKPKCFWCLALAWGSAPGFFCPSFPLLMGAVSLTHFRRSSSAMQAQARSLSSQTNTHLHCPYLLPFFNALSPLSANKCRVFLEAVEAETLSCKSSSCEPPCNARRLHIPDNKPQYTHVPCPFHHALAFQEPPDGLLD
jgi:hypothetical protein